MRKLWVLSFLAILWHAPAAATEIDWMDNVFGCKTNLCVIHASKGGIIGRFENAANEALEKHVQIRIDGECSSSCVIFASKTRDNVCLTRNAVMGIHMGFTFDLYDPKGNRVVPDITTGKNVDIFENPPEGYIRRGHYAELDYGQDIVTWARANHKMPASDSVYQLTWNEAMMFWKPCE